MNTTIIIICWVILWYLIIMSLGYTILLVASIPDIINRFKENEIGNIDTLFYSHNLPPVTAIIVAYNEENPLFINCIQSVLKNNYPNKNIIIVNNGSTDNTLEMLELQFDLYKIPTPILDKIPTRGLVKAVYVSKTQKNIMVIDKTDKDKSDGVNMALNLCNTPLFFTLDADTLLESDSISKILFPMLTQPHTIAIGGAVYILNGCKYENGVMSEPRLSHSPLYVLQACEYLRSFMFGRAGWNTFGGSLSYSGAFTAFETQAVLNNNGFQTDNFANDLEIILHLQATKYEKKYPYVIYYTPGAAAWTDVPGTLKDYWNQRVQWQYGSLLSFFQFKRMFFNPRYKLIGLYVYPFFLTGEVFGSIVEFLAYLTVIVTWSMGILDTHWAILLFIACWGFITFLTIATTCLSLLTFNKYRRANDIFLILLYSIVEQFGFRQFHVLSRLWGTVLYFKNVITRQK